jgi:hypothetical protein
LLVARLTPFAAYVELGHDRNARVQAVEIMCISPDYSVASLPVLKVLKDEQLRCRFKSYLGEAGLK